MLRFRVRFGLLLACLVASLTACGVDNEPKPLPTQKVEPVSEIAGSAFDPVEHESSLDRLVPILQIAQSTRCNPIMVTNGTTALPRHKRKGCTPPPGVDAPGGCGWCATSNGECKVFLESGANPSGVGVLGAEGAYALWAEGVKLWVNDMLVDEGPTPTGGHIAEFCEGPIPEFSVAPRPPSFRTCEERQRREKATGFASCEYPGVERCQDVKENRLLWAGELSLGSNCKISMRHPTLAEMESYPGLGDHGAGYGKVCADGRFSLEGDMLLSMNDKAYRVPMGATEVTGTIQNCEIASPVVR